MRLRLIIVLILSISTVFLNAGWIENVSKPDINKLPILTGADQIEKYLPYLKAKKLECW